MTFPEVWQISETIPGWLKRGQAELLYDNAHSLGPGRTVLEIGSHRGKSAVVLAAAVQEKGGRVICLDPFVEGRLFGGATTRTEFEQNVESAGVASLIELIADYSTKARPLWDRDLDMLYIDGKHDYWTFTDDLLWRKHLPPGAPILVHDAFSSIGVTLGILARVLPSSDLIYVSRSDSMALFRVGKPTWRDRGRILAEMPWWIRNVGLKVLLRLRLRRVARLFGHDSPYDPY